MVKRIQNIFIIYVPLLNTQRVILILASWKSKFNMPGMETGQVQLRVHLLVIQCQTF